MKANITVDNRMFYAALRKITISGSDLLNVEGSGARVQVNLQRQLVPVDTAATQNSVNSHIEEASTMRVVDEIGPETEYAPFIEMGVRSKPNYPAQPFVRPAAVQGLPSTIRAIGTSFGELVKLRWPL